MKSAAHQRIVIGMLDGLGMECYNASPMPHLKEIEKKAIVARTVSGVFPSVTNVNNVSIVCGAFPSVHGITANSYFDTATGEAKYMNDARLIKTPTIFKRAREWGFGSALLTTKKKTAELFGSSADICVAAEAAPADAVASYGAPPPIYSREINYWIWDVAADMLKNLPDIGLFYVHTTDYPMHAWDEKAPESLEHLRELDKRIGKARDNDPQAAFLFTADHGMNPKSRCYDLKKICKDAGCPIRFALSPERDYYVAHHRNFTGCSWLWLIRKSDRNAVRNILLGLEGVERVADSADIARQFSTDESRLGDLVVFGDRVTMFGEMDFSRKSLPNEYRAHGSLHEMDVPLIIYNYRHTLPRESFFTHNLDLTRFLLRV